MFKFHLNKRKTVLIILSRSVDDLHGVAPWLKIIVYSLVARPSGCATFIIQIKIDAK